MVPRVEIVEKGLTQDVRDSLLFYKERIQETSSEPVKQLLMLCLLSVVNDVSLTKKDGGFLRIVPNKPIPDIKNVFRKKINKAVNDLAQHKLIAPSKTRKSRVTVGDSRKLEMPEESISLVVTSPPYLIKTDYTRIYSLELCLGFVKSFHELRKIRYNSIRSNVEARHPKIDVSVPESLSSNLEELVERPLTNPRHPQMIAGYFEDMYLSLKELARVTEHNGRICYVVRNSRFSGIHFQTDLYCSEMGESLGLTVDKVLVPLLRGTSAQQAKTYGEIPLRESIIIFRKD